MISRFFVILHFGDFILQLTDSSGPFTSNKKTREHALVFYFDDAAKFKSLAY